MQIGDTAETEIVSVTLDNAEMAIALGNSLPFGADAENKDVQDLDFLLPHEYTSDDTDNPFVASKGHVLIAYTITVTNLDRDSVDIDALDDSFIKIQYDGTEYTCSDQDESEIGLEIDSEGNWRHYISSNILASAGETSTYRCFIEVPFEPESLDDPFSIVLTLPNIDDTTTSFTFDINQPTE